jgi:DNA-binding NarL/FixJ family response regulator
MQADASLEPQERLLQTLNAMLMQIHTLQTLIEPSQAPAGAQTLQEGFHTLEQMARAALSAAQASSLDQPLSELEGGTLTEAITRLVEETAEMRGLSSRISLTGSKEQSGAGNLPPVIERLLYLLAKEALYQIQQHTDGRRLRLTLHYGQDELEMSIEDDGIIPLEASDDVLPTPPFAEEQGRAREQAVQNSLVLRDLRYHLEQVGGTLEIQTLGERGTRFTARVAYQPSLSEEQEPLSHGQGRDQQSPSLPTPVEPVRILIVEGQPVLRAGLHHLLAGYPDLQVVGEATDGIQAVSETLELGPQVVLMDAHLPDDQSKEAIQQIKHLNLNTRVLLLTTLEREEYLYETLRAGGDGYILKDVAPDELAQAVRSVARGEALIQPQLAGRLLSRLGGQASIARYETLTTRELEVLRLLAEGLRNKEIAARLFVSERTVNFHLANIYQKLNVSGRTEALSKAISRGLIQP